MKVLVADDEDGWRDLLARWLKDAGYEVEVASSGADALALAQRWPPHCFLLDYDLGDTTGHAVCAALKARPEFKAIPVVILTANVGVLPKIVADFPPDQFVAKSESSVELLLLLDTLLAK